MGRLVIVLLMLLLVNLGASDLRAQDQIRDLVVKIHAVHHTPDVLRPWSRNTPQQIKGSGVVIDGNRILTNAHVVRYASQIYVQPNQSSQHLPARVDAITPSMDLAILKLDDEAFFDKAWFASFCQRAASRQRQHQRLRLSDRWHRAFSNSRNCFAHRIHRLLLSGGRSTHPGRCGAQFRQQRWTRRLGRKTCRLGV